MNIHDFFSSVLLLLFCVFSLLPNAEKTSYILSSLKKPRSLWINSTSFFLLSTNCFHKLIIKGMNRQNELVFTAGLHTGLVAKPSLTLPEQFIFGCNHT